tara:strand:+ start:294 stop:422 length:129 start_codon:yes stop_codon:yes gene_type:complete
MTRAAMSKIIIELDKEDAEKVLEDHAEILQLLREILKELKDG